MILNKQNLKNIHPQGISIPTATVLALPEKVLQFGTGVLLRGLPNYYIDKANKQGIFNGSIVVVKSTGNGDADEFSNQDNLFTHCIKGVKNNQLIEETTINAAISRVLSAKTNWLQILQTATNPNIQLILSNTTEVGIVLDENDSIHHDPPTSFPGKLLAWLHHRYDTFNGSNECGVTIVPTELITDNGNKLKLITKALAEKNNLSPAFIHWLQTANDFCNSLVDRIVPGKLPTQQHIATQAALGYTDDLMIMSEPYSLWAIETSSQKSKDVLSFSQVDDGIIISPNINKFRELKLRLLNGTHTFSCGLAFLTGFDTVKDAMANSTFNLYLHDLMTHEISPCIENVEISRLETYEFAKAVIDRFRNPSINHHWLSITMNFTGKMKMRNIPLIIEHYNRYNTTPKYMAIGFAAYILFMKAITQNDGKYYGIHNNQSYLINDDMAAYFYQLWSHNNAAEVVTKTLSNIDLWDRDLNSLPNFANTVTSYLHLFQQGKFLNTLAHLEKNKEEVGV
jgi:tagaturonate reductase